MISTRVRAIKISETKRMPMLAAQVWGPGGCVSLGQGVPAIDTPAHVKDAVCRAMAEDPLASRYSLQPGMPALRRAIAEQLAAERGMQVDPESQIGVTVGAMEALLCAMFTVLDPGDEVLVPAPCYPSHVEQIVLAGGVPAYVECDPADWQLDPEALAAAVTPRTKAMIVCTPSNPTGAIFSREVLDAVAQVARKHGLILICDETYDVLTFGPDGAPAERAPSLSDDPSLDEQRISVFSCSKRYALTGWRVGYMVASPALMAELLKVHDCTAICAPTPSQVAALAAITGPQEPFGEMRHELARRRQICLDGLAGLDGAFQCVAPTGAFYIMARYGFSQAKSQEIAERLIREARVITVPGGAFGPCGEGHLRLSFGGTPEELTEAFARIAAWLP